jgi:hypothetical protein
MSKDRLIEEDMTVDYREYRAVCEQLAFLKHRISEFENRSVESGIGRDRLRKYQNFIRNKTLTEVAHEIEKLPFGDTAASFALFVKGMKK